MKAYPRHICVLKMSTRSNRMYINAHSLALRVLSGSLKLGVLILTVSAEGPSRAQGADLLSRGTDDKAVSRLKTHWRGAVCIGSDFSRGGSGTAERGKILLLFSGGFEPPCMDACDADDDGAVTITDGIYTLQNLFAHGPALPPPYPDCGLDPTADDGVGGLDCESYEHCP